MKVHDLQVEHLAFPSFNPDETWRFYTEVMRLPLTGVTSSEDGDPWLLTSFGLADGRQLVFCTVKDMEWPRDDGPHEWLNHYAFSVTSAEAFQEWRSHLGKLGVKFTEEDHGDQQSIYFNDPNGVLLELNYPPRYAQPIKDVTGALQRMRHWARTHLHL